MKTTKTTFLLALFLCFTFNLSQAQQAYQVHQDNVKPSMLMEYEKIAKESFKKIYEDPKKVHVGEAENFINSRVAFICWHV